MKTLQEKLSILTQQWETEQEEGISFGTALKDFVNDLAEEELFDFVEGILTEKPDIVETLFEDSKNVLAGEAAFTWLLNTPHSTRRKMQHVLEKIYEQAQKASGKYHKSAIVINKIYAICSSNRGGLSVEFIKHEIEKIDIASSKGKAAKKKLELLLLLVNHEDFRDYQFLKDHVDLGKDPYLAPVLINAYRKNNYLEASGGSPRKSLDVLTQIEANAKIPADFRTYFVSSIRFVTNQIFELLPDMKEQLYEEYSAAIKNTTLREIFEKAAEKHLEKTVSPVALDPVLETESQTVGTSTEPVVQETEKTEEQLEAASPDSGSERNPEMATHLLSLLTKDPSQAQQIAETIKEDEPLQIAIIKEIDQRYFSDETKRNSTRANNVLHQFESFLFQLCELNADFPILFTKHTTENFIFAIQGREIDTSDGKLVYSFYQHSDSEPLDAFQKKFSTFEDREASLSNFSVNF